MDTQKQNIGKDEAELFAQLKSILLKEERQEIQKVQETVYTQENLSKEVSPIVEEHIELLKNNFPNEFKVVVDKMIAKKIQDSREEIVNAIYPEVGKMIKKYVGHQIQMLKDGIENQIKGTFNSKGFFGKVKARFGWKQTSEEIIQNLNKPVIEEIFIIQKGSGLLVGSATRNDLVDQDVAAGMLTAIKSFVEDAFGKGNEEVETIEYGSYRIVLQGFPSWYMATALSGTLTTKEKDELSNQILDFASSEMPSQLDEINSEVQEKLSLKLDQFFIKEKVLQD
ncbi:MAG: hypothetical protein AB8H03_20415 [Saprospiraceae bacterium]